MHEQPAGTLTFLFTDIEGSTRLWEEKPETMRAALRRHDEILRESIERNRGYVFKTVGDAFCASFADASDAIRAALDIQSRIRAEEWALPCPLRVRAALHSGTAEVRDNDYFGPSLNRTARLLSLVAGGQTVVSRVTGELLHDTLPQGATLVDLGSYRLKDLARPERVYELRAAGVEDVFPPLKSLDSHPNNLPVQLTEFVGRERDLDELKREVLSGRARFITLLGPGGIGKTRLSLQVAADLAEHFGHGVYMVDLALVRDARDVPRAILQILRVPETPGRSAIEQLREWIGHRRIIIVLDNVEQVVDCGKDAAGLIAFCPQLQLIVTSRESLRVRGERVIRVPPLGLPQTSRKQSADPEEMQRYEAVRLFVARARDANPSFVLDRDNVEIIADICIRLDGLPLALELAAARVSALSPSDLLDRLGQRLALLTGGPRDLPERQQTLRATIAWSYALLSSEEQATFSTLSVFPGSFTVRAGEHLCQALYSQGHNVIGLIQALVDKSLVAVVQQSARVSRFRLLESIREFGLAELGEGEHKDSLRCLHAEFYLRLAEMVRSELEGPDQKRYFEELDWEVENIRTACDYLSSQGEHASVVRLVTALGPYWQVRGRYAETRAMLERALLPEAHPADEIAGLALLWIGIMATQQHDFTAADSSLMRAIEMARAVEDRLLEATALQEAGSNKRRQRRLDESRLLESQALQLAKQAGDEFLAARCEFGLAVCDLWSGLSEGLRQRVEASRVVFHRGGYFRWEASALHILGVLAYFERDLQASTAYYEQAVEIAVSLGDVSGLCRIYANLGMNCQLRGDFQRALELNSRIADLARASGIAKYIIHAEVGKAEAYLGMGELVKAVASIEQAQLFIDQYAWPIVGDRGCCLRVSASIKEAQGDSAAARKEYARAIAALRDADQSVRDELELAEASLKRLLDQKDANSSAEC